MTESRSGGSLIVGQVYLARGAGVNEQPPTYWSLEADEHWQRYLQELGAGASRGKETSCLGGDCN